MSENRADQFEKHVRTLMELYAKGLTDVVATVRTAYESRGVDLTDEVMCALEKQAASFTTNLVRGQCERVALHAQIPNYKKPRIFRWERWVPCAVEPKPVPAKSALVPRKPQPSYAPVGSKHDLRVDPNKFKKWDTLPASQLLGVRHYRSHKHLLTEQMLYTLAKAVEYVEGLGFDEGDDPFVLRDTVVRQQEGFTAIGVGRSLAALLKYGVVRVGKEDGLEVYYITQRSYDVYTFAKIHEHIPTWEEILHLREAKGK